MKTMHEIREILSQQMDDLGAKKTTASSVNAICNATGKFISTVKLEMEYSKMIGKQPSTSFLRLMERPQGEKATPTNKKAA